jgi:hypothetical protein
MKPEFLSWPVRLGLLQVAQTFLSASWGDFPVAPSRTGKSGASAGWKACPTLVGLESQVFNFGIR